ncbi:hypothetical protein D9M69_520950 [compost metagenome]
MHLEQARHQRHQLVMPEGHTRIDAHPPARRRTGSGATFGLVHVGQHACAALVEMQPLGRELQLARGAVHQLDAQAQLEPRHQLADGRGRHVEQARRRRETARLHHLHEGLHFAGAVDVDARHGFPSVVT